MPPQGRIGGPGPSSAVPQTGRAGGSTPPPPASVRRVTVNGETYEVPLGTTDAEIAEVLGSAPERSGAFGSRAEFGGPSDEPSTFTKIISNIPSAMQGGIGMIGALKQPMINLGTKMLGRAVPALTSHQANIAVRAGAAPLLKSSITKLAGNPTTQKVMSEAMPGRWGGSVVPELGAAGVGSWLHPAVGTAVAAGKAATRPLPFSMLAQGAANAGPALGPAVGAAGGGLASYLLQMLTSGGK